MSKRWRRLRLINCKPAFLNCEGVRRQILAFAGPWKRKGGWWSETAWAREEWDVALKTFEGIAYYRIYLDRIRKRWFVEGVFD